MKKSVWMALVGGAMMCLGASPILAASPISQNFEVVAQRSAPFWLLSLLLCVGFMAVVLALFVRTHGVAGLVAVGCFFAYFYLSYRSGAAGIWEIACFLVGVLLLIVEALIPGFGLPGIAGTALVVIGLVMSAENATWSVVQILLSLCIAVGLGAMLTKMGYRSRILRNVVLQTSLTEEQGYSARKQNDLQVGQRGLTYTNLRPTGEILIQGKRYEAMTQGEFIQKGKSIVVVQVLHGKTVVQEAAE